MSSDLDDWVFGGPDHKLAQLCSQVEEAVNYALISSRDADLRDLLCEGVDSLRGASRLRVRVGLGPAAAIDVEAAEQALERGAGYLRGEVARAVNRKRVPELVFEVALPPVD